LVQSSSTLERPSQGADEFMWRQLKNVIYRNVSFKLSSKIMTSPPIIQLSRQSGLNLPQLKDSEGNDHLEGAVATTDDVM
jgi:hypothetical protein